jgi:hypothetical protein
MLSTARHHRCENDDLWIGFYRLLKGLFPIGAAKFVETDNYLLLSYSSEFTGNINRTWMRGIIFWCTGPGTYFRI